MTDKDMNIVGHSNDGALRASLAMRLVLFVFLITPVLLGMLFSYLTWINFQRIHQQFQVDLSGVETNARIERLEIEGIVHHKPSNMDTAIRRPAPDRICNLTVSYRAQGSSLIRKELRYEDDTICQGNEIGDNIIGKYYSKDPNIFILNDSRLSIWWFVLTLGLSFVFLLAPMILILRALIRKRKI